MHIAEGETLELNIDLPENAITFTAINVPENSKSVWMWVKDANFRDADGEKYLEFIERTRHQTVSMARLFKIGSRPYKGKVWGLEPGTYHLAAVSHAAPGWAGLYLDDNEKIRKYLEQTFDAPQLITIDESTQEIEIDFEGAENRAYRFNLDD